MIIHHLVFSVNMLVISFINHVVVLMIFLFTLWLELLICFVYPEVKSMICFVYPTIVPVTCYIYNTNTVRDGAEFNNKLKGVMVYF
jgi:hypothetical protein